MSDEELADHDSGMLARFDAVLDELTAVDLDARTDDQVLALWRELETRRNRLAPIDHRLITQAQERHLDQRHGARSVAMLARGALRLGAGEARARVRAADAAGPRRSPSGLPLEPKYTDVAAGQAAGSLAPAAARAITDTLDKLPSAVPEGSKSWAEQFLVEQAGHFDTDTLRGLCAKVTDTLDPDGLLNDHEYRHATRTLGVHVRRDGSAQLRGELTAELTEHLRVMFDSLAAPKPAADGAKDTRSAGQRRHDALLDAVKRLERADQLPDTGGVSATLLLTMTTDATTADSDGCGDDGNDSHDGDGEQAGSATDDTVQRDTVQRDAGTTAGTPRTLAPARQPHGTVRSNSGPYRLAGHRLARTGHGTLIPPAEALRWAGGDVRILTVAFDRLGRVSAHGHAQRLFTEGQRLAMTARDLGCSFPGCDVPPSWCEAHHVTEYAKSGRTTIDEGTLLCGFHHREFERLGWICTMIHSVPHWTPPWWVDPDQVPIRNHAHDPVPTG